MKNALIILFIAVLYTCISYISNEKNKQNNTYHNYNAIKEYHKADGNVNDFEEILSIEEEEYLDSLISTNEKATTNQIAVVTVKSIEPYQNISDFTQDLGNYWGIGSSDVGNGLIIALSKNMKQVRISTSFGTEKILQDDQIKNIIDNEMLPYFRTGQYFDGIKNGLVVLIYKWR